MTTIVTCYTIHDKVPDACLECLSLCSGGDQIKALQSVSGSGTAVCVSEASFSWRNRESEAGDGEEGGSEGDGENGTDTKVARVWSLIDINLTVPHVSNGSHVFEGSVMKGIVLRGNWWEWQVGWGLGRALSWQPSLLRWPDSLDRYICIHIPLLSVGA